MPTRSRRARAATAIVAALVVVGCSSGDSDPDESSSTPGSVVADVDPSGDDGVPEEPEPSPAADTLSADECRPLLEARPRLVTLGNLLPVAEDQETVESMFGPGDLEAREADVALFRPHQDVQGEVFGTLRDGLDRLEQDIAAVREGRFDDRVGDYGLVSIVPVLVALGC